VIDLKKSLRLVVAIGLLLASIDASALSEGSPVCTINTATMNTKMGPRIGDNPNGWFINPQSATYSPGQATFDIKIERQQPNPPPDPPIVYTFKGLLLWATDASGNQVGTWELPSSDFQRKCNNQSITHVNNTEKNAPTLAFKLALPISVRGAVTIKAFIVQSERRRHFEVISAHVHTDPLRNDLDVDTSVTTTKYHAFTDGALVMRFLLGLRGQSLTRGVKSNAAIRTDSEIETQLTSLRDLGKLDVDGNGQTRAETDGLLVLRYLLGYRGQRLITGVNGGTLTAQQIETNIAALLP
jgi:hypothetical protein